MVPANPPPSQQDAPQILLYKAARALLTDATPVGIPTQQDSWQILMYKIVTGITTGTLSFEGVTPPNMVTTNTAQTITGAKTFSGNVTVSGTGGNVVTTGTNQTITGTKTFAADQIIQGTNGIAFTTTGSFAARLFSDGSGNTTLQTTDNAGNFSGVTVTNGAVTLTNQTVSGGLYTVCNLMVGNGVVEIGTPYTDVATTVQVNGNATFNQFASFNAGWGGLLGPNFYPGYPGAAGDALNLNNHSGNPKVSIAADGPGIALLTDGGNMLFSANPSGVFGPCATNDPTLMSLSAGAAAMFGIDPVSNQPCVFYFDGASYFSCALGTPVPVAV